MTGLGYTGPAVLSVAAVCVWELAFLRTGLFRRASYWVAMAIVLAFQIPVDGWLTKLPAPVVRYAPRQMTGLRFPWDIPVEDFLFGFALVTSALLLWEHQGRRRADPGSGPGRRRAPGRPAPGRPAPGRPAPGRPASGHPAPGRPAPGRPAPGHPAPRGELR